MQTPSPGRILIVRNHGQGYEDAPAVITRVWSPDCINVQVLPDCNAPACKTSVKLFADEADATAYLATLPGHTPCVAWWPARV